MTLPPRKVVSIPVKNREEFEMALMRAQFASQIAAVFGVERDLIFNEIELVQPVDGVVRF